jgi:hypothetical protein
MSDAQSSGMRLIWAVRYRDATTFNQFQDGRERSTEEIDRSKLHTFSLLDQRGRTVIQQEVLPGQCFFYRRRTAMRAGHGVLDVVHIFGWRLAADKSVRHVCFLYESDFHVELGDFCLPGQRGREEAWKHPVEFLPVDDIPVAGPAT